MYSGNSMKRRTRNGIMITGCPRSGSTILAKVLALSPSVGYAEEPFNSQTGMIGTDDRFFPYIYPGSTYQQQYDQLLHDILTSQAHYKENVLQPPTKNPLRLTYRHFFTNRYHIRYWLDTHNPRVSTLVLKDPTASLSAEHFTSHPKLSVIYTLRHPCGVIASHIRLGWVGSPLESLLQDTELRNKFSQPVQESIHTPQTTAQTLAWYWRAINEIILQSCKKNSSMPIVSHEAFSQNPQAITRSLYRAYNIDYSPKIAAQLRELTGETNPTDPTNNDIHVLKRNSRDNAERWRKLLKPEEQEQIMEICGNTYSQLAELPNNVKA